MANIINIGTSGCEICAQLTVRCTRFLPKISSITALHIMTDAGPPIHLPRVSTLYVSFARRIIPTYELAVCFFRAKKAVLEKVACSLRFLREGNDVWSGRQIPVFMIPEFATSSESSLNFIHDQESPGLVRDLLEPLEEHGRGMVVATLALDGLDDGTRYKEAEVCTARGLLDQPN